LARVIVGPNVERGGILPVTNRTVASGHLALELPSMRVCVALLALAGCGSKESDGRSLIQHVATDAGNRCMCAGQRIDRCMRRDAVPCGDESFLLVAVGALRVAGEELPLMRVRMAGVALTWHESESAHPRIRVGRMALDARHTDMGTSQGIGIRMASCIKLSGLELCAGMAVGTIRIPITELSTVRVRMATLASLRLPHVAGGFRIRISLAVIQPGHMTLLAGHCCVHFVERKARQGMGLRLDATDAFRPCLIGSQMTRCAIAGPSCAMRRLMAVRTGRSFHFLEGHPHVIDIRNLGLGSIVRGRRRMALGAADAGVRTIQHIVVIMPEPDRRSKRLLAVAELAGTSQSPGMDVLVTIGTILGQANIRRATRMRRETGQREGPGQFPHVARIACQAVVRPGQREWNMGVLEVIGISPLPG
jgi:hypothetical protein